MTISMMAKRRQPVSLNDPLDEEVGITLFKFDASISENYSKQAVLTDHPVEEGADISDHVRSLPEEVEINGWVSNNPIIAAASIREGSPPRSIAEDAYGELRRIMDERVPVRLVTALREFDNMILTSISVVRNKDTGRIIDATIKLRELIIATTETTDAPEPEQSNRKKKQNKGKQTGKEATDQQNTSIVGSLTGVAG